MSAYRAPGHVFSMGERRYYGLDALRGVMMLLGIVLHTAMFYAEPEVIPMADRHRSLFFNAVLLFIHSFRMPLFFLLSGFFWALLVDKYGLKRAYGNRVERILVPFLIGLVTVVPLASWLALSFGVSVEAGARILWTAKPAHLKWAERFVRTITPEVERIPAPAHLWFLYDLMLFYLLMPVCVLARRLVERPAWVASSRRWLASPWLPVAGAAWTAVCLWPYPGAFVGIQYLLPRLSSFFYYETFFVVGFLFHAFRDALTTCQRHLGAYAAASGALFLAALWPSSLDFQQGGRTIALHSLTVGLNALLTWMLAYASMGLFQRFADRDTPWVAYASQSSYWVYLVHLPIASFAAWGMVELDLPAYVNIAVASAFTAVVSFTSYHYLARRTWISVLLNGRRFSLRWPWLEPAGRPYSVPLSLTPEPSGR